MRRKNKEQSPGEFRKLYELSENLVSVDESKYEEARGEWSEQVDNTTTRDIVDTISMLSTEKGKKTRDLKAVREALMSEVDRRIISTMETLDKSAKRLQIALWVVGAVLTIAGIFVGVIGIWRG